MPSLEDRVGVASILSPTRLVAVECEHHAPSGVLGLRTILDSPGRPHPGCCFAMAKEASRVSCPRLPFIVHSSTLGPVDRDDRFVTEAVMPMGISRRLEVNDRFSATGRSEAHQALASAQLAEAAAILHPTVALRSIPLQLAGSPANRGLVLGSGCLGTASMSPLRILLLKPGRRKSPELRSARWSAKAEELHDRYDEHRAGNTDQPVARGRQRKAAADADEE